MIRNLEAALFIGTRCVSEEESPLTLILAHAAGSDCRGRDSLARLLHDDQPIGVGVLRGDAEGNRLTAANGRHGSGF